MKNIILICFLLLSKGLFAQSDSTVYLDNNDNPITKDDFLKASQKAELVVKNDSLDIFKIISQRSVTGQISNFEEIFSAITTTYPELVLDKSKPLVIQFYPGKDTCNSTGSASRSFSKKWYSDLEKNIYKIAETKPIYIYRKEDGLEKYDGIITWHKDPKNIIEKNFFKFHYPCSSYVIIMPNGKFISYYGEFSNESVWEDLKKIMKTK